MVRRFAYQLDLNLPGLCEYFPPPNIFPPPQNPAFTSFSSKCIFVQQDRPFSPPEYFHPQKKLCAAYFLREVHFWALRGAKGAASNHRKQFGSRKSALTTFSLKCIFGKHGRPSSPPEYFPPKKTFRAYRGGKYSHCLRRYSLRLAKNMTEPS